MPLPPADARPPLKDDLLGEAQRRQVVQVLAAAGLPAAALEADTAPGWAALALMARLARLGQAICDHGPADFRALVDLAEAVAPALPAGFAPLALCDAVSRRGHPDDAQTLAALARLTRFGTAEFAVRPLLARDPARVLHQARVWASDPDAHVRRLASEGTRPRLPWGQRLDALARDPSGQRPILRALWADPSEDVRRSVANHLNDIAKVHPAWVLEQLATWPCTTPAARATLRHALRGLIKQGHPGALALVGAGQAAQVTVSGWQVSPTPLHLGEAALLQVTLTGLGPGTQTLEVDYGVHFVKHDGSARRKVFKWRALSLAPGQSLELHRRHRVADFTTRRHHAGRHTVDLIVNGQTLAQGHFDLVC
ncbi:DNA alkylation repair protein [Ideonella livida]|uniref:DNA alkylation repair protein n=1 Tax=Ideonella livida TaxID=2707176 RepID=A0A7C9PEW3_9BURK|nr:DNA alkylation repair protein [Ideonella livida]NDY90176.1 DNA alkylation repair protein [Ideonella livida]